MIWSNATLQNGIQIFFPYQLLKSIDVEVQPDAMPIHKSSINVYVCTMFDVNIILRVCLSADVWIHVIATDFRAQPACYNDAERRRQRRICELEKKKKLKKCCIQ